MIDISLRVAIRQTQTIVTQPRYFFAWDDQISSFNYRCRTQMADFEGPDNPPAVLRFYPIMREGAGDFRVNISAWRDPIIQLNGGGDEGLRRFEYWINPNTAQFNSTGWPQLAYLGMCGNELQGERVGDWFKFVTLRPDDFDRIAGWTIESHPCFIHRFVCVTWDRATQTTKHILSTGTPRGEVFYPVITKEGYGYIPTRFVKEIT